MSIVPVRRIWPALLLAIGLLAACTSSPTPGGSGGSDLPEEVKQLPVSFYQGATAEPGGTFDLDKVRSATADPLQSAVVTDLEQTQSGKAATAYYRYQDTQVLGGSCSGQGANRLCELRVQRVFDATDAAGNPQGARNDTRIFRARQIDGKWRLTDTQVDGRWLTDIASSGGASAPGGGAPAPGG